MPKRQCTEAAKYHKSCVCGKVSASDTDIFLDGNKLGHTYGAPASFTWKEDYSAAVATAVCKTAGCDEQSQDHSKKFDAKITKKEENGKIIYTASVVIGSETYTDTKSVDAPKPDDPEKPTDPEKPVDPGKGDEANSLLNANPNFSDTNPAEANLVDTTPANTTGVIGDSSLISAANGSKASSNAKVSAVKTGDETRLGFMIGMFVVSFALAIGCFYVYYKKKKHSKYT